MEATNGKLDFFDVNPNLPKFAVFAFEFPMTGGTAALFGDDTGSMKAKLTDKTIGKINLMGLIPA